MIATRCQSCEVAYINGIRCHEHGCPDAWMDYTRECKWCGSEYQPLERDQRFCEESCTESYYGTWIALAHTPEERHVAMGKRSEYYRRKDDKMAHCCLDKETVSSPTFSTREAKELFKRASAAGMAAGNGSTPTPMVVGTPTTFLGNDIDYSKDTYYIPDGPCGFAWVTIRPGNCSLARQAVKLGIGKSAYGGGVSIWISDHNQSMERKERHAGAYARVLRDAGVEAYPQSRMD